jgi:beta-glucanase (GH16 family)
MGSIALAYTIAACTGSAGTPGSDAARAGADASEEVGGDSGASASGTGGSGGSRIKADTGADTGGAGGDSGGMDAGGDSAGMDAGSSNDGDGGNRDGGMDGAWSDASTLFFDDFLGSSIDTTKWTIFDRISDQSNGEINCCVPANVSVSGGLLRGASRYEDHTCGDSQQAPVTEHYTSWQIQQKTAPFLYGTIEVRARPPGGTGIWPTIWMLGFEWQASQPATANIPGHQWPKNGWCEIDIAEFWQNARSQVNCTVHFNTPGGLHEQPLPFDATTRFMVYRLQWTPGSLVWSVDAEDGAGFRALRTVDGAGNVPDMPMYVVINAAIGGNGGGTPDPSSFPQTFEVDWVRITQ